MSPDEKPVPEPETTDTTATDQPSVEAGIAATADEPAGADIENGAASVGTDIEKLKALAAQASEHWDRFLRSKAELENYRKRAARERQEAIRYANLSLLEKLIPTLDNFDKALAAASQNPEDTSSESLREGVEMVYAQFKAALTAAGVEEIDASGKAFDHNVHEAVSQMESSDVPEGHVLQQLRKGYKLHDRLIRPASVIVAKQPAD
jgi:molecular chaperone GrpE